MFFKASIPTVFVSLVIGFSSQLARAEAIGSFDSFSVGSSMMSKPVTRAQSEIEIKRLRQLIAARKIDADELMRVLHEISGRTSQR